MVWDIHHNKGVRRDELNVFAHGCRAGQDAVSVCATRAGARALRTGVDDLIALDRADRGIGEVCGRPATDRYPAHRSTGLARLARGARLLQEHRPAPRPYACALRPHAFLPRLRPPHRAGRAALVQTPATGALRKFEVARFAREAIQNPARRVGDVPLADNRRRDRDYSDFVNQLVPTGGKPWPHDLIGVAQAERAIDDARLGKKPMLSAVDGASLDIFESRSFVRMAQVSAG